LSISYGHKLLLSQLFKDTKPSATIHPRQDTDIYMIEQIILIHQSQQSLNNDLISETEEMKHDLQREIDRSHPRPSHWRTPPQQYQETSVEEPEMHQSSHDNQQGLQFPSFEVEIN
jgi:hypothetical protein